LCVTHKKCLEINCNISPYFNYENEKIGIYCSKHKKDNMVDLNSKRCLEDNCKLRPLFNYENKKTGIYCSQHKKENMIDVKSKRCIEKNCNKCPYFNFENKQVGIYCLDHKKENMINIRDKKCLDQNCIKRATCNFENKPTLYCELHKKNNMINVKVKRCLEDNCTTITNKNKYKGHCLRCFIFKFPNEKISKNYKVKENHMTDFIKENFKDEVMIFDKQINGGCSLCRPDVYIDKFTHIIIIECDENQHKDREEICENKRIMQIFEDFNSRPVIFIRFNPDSYKINNKTILSSFKYHKTLQVPMIRESKEWNNRLELLKNKINYWLINIPKKEITNEHLFYDSSS
jgi:hypothetical protein